MPPMPSVQGYAPGSINVPYGTWDNVSQYSNPYAFNIPGYGQNNPMTGQGATAANASAYMNPAAQNIPGGAPNPMMNQGATMDNIQSYVNPFLDKILANGTNQIEHSGAAKGLFGSTGNINDIGNWATQASSQAYNDAANRFAQDRGYFSDQAWNQYGAGVNAQQNAMNAFSQDRNYFNNNQWQGYNAGNQAAQQAQSQFNTDRSTMLNQANTQTANDNQNYWNTYNANWDQYKYGDASYQGKLGDYYSQNNAISNTGQTASNNVGNINSNLGTALAQLFGNQGGVQAQGAVNSGNQNISLISGLLSALLSGMV